MTGSFPLKRQHCEQYLTGKKMLYRALSFLFYTPDLHLSLSLVYDNAEFYGFAWCFSGHGRTGVYNMRLKLIGRKSSQLSQLIKLTTALNS